MLDARRHEMILLFKKPWFPTAFDGESPRLGPALALSPERDIILIT